MYKILIFDPEHEKNDTCSFIETHLKASVTMFDLSYYNEITRLVFLDDHLESLTNEGYQKMSIGLSIPSRKQLIVDYNVLHVEFETLQKKHMAYWVWYYKNVTIKNRTRYNKFFLLCKPDDLTQLKQIISNT